MAGGDKEVMVRKCFLSRIITYLKFFMRIRLMQAQQHILVATIAEPSILISGRQVEGMIFIQAWHTRVIIALWL